MSDNIGYELTDQDIAAVVKWLEINDPVNANTDFARNMLLEARSMIREIGSVDEDYLHKIHEEYKKKIA